MFIKPEAEQRLKNVGAVLGPVWMELNQRALRDHGPAHGEDVVHAIWRVLAAAPALEDDPDDAQEVWEARLASFEEALREGAPSPFTSLEEDLVCGKILWYRHVMGPLKEEDAFLAGAPKGSRHPNWYLPGDLEDRLTGVPVALTPSEMPDSDLSGEQQLALCRVMVALPPSPSRPHEDKTHWEHEVRAHAGWLRAEPAYIPEPSARWMDFCWRKLMWYRHIRRECP
jgi:hypothetical protein